MRIAKVQQLPFISFQSFVLSLPVPWKLVKNWVVLAHLYFVLKSNVLLSLQKTVMTAKATYVSDMNSIVVSSQLY